MKDLIKRRIAAVAIWPLLFAIDVLATWAGVDTWPRVRADSVIAFNLMWGSKP